MEFAGNEKRVQALFSELLREGQRVVPEFETLWTTAERVGPAQVRATRKSLIVIVFAVIILGTAAFVASSWGRVNPDEALEIPAPKLAPPSLAAPEQPKHNATVAVSHSERRKKPPHSRQIERTFTTDAALLSKWQSPTQSYMNSPVAVSFNSLPQLNQSAEELKQFLPSNPDFTKESNQ